MVHCWNHGQGCERDLNNKWYTGCYEHEIIHNLQIAADFQGKEQYFGNLLNPNDFATSGETSNTPIVRRTLQLIEPIAAGTPALANKAVRVLTSNNKLGGTVGPMETTINMSGKRTSANIPVTKMTADDCNLYNELIPRHQHNRSQGRQHSTYYEKLCIEHISRALDESFKPIKTRKRIFAKSVPILKAHHKALQVRENKQKTKRKLAFVVDPTTGIMQSTRTVRRGVPQVHAKFGISASL